VDLIEVDPVGLQPAQTRLARPDDPAARVAAPIAPLAHLEVHLRRKDHLVAAAAQGLADDLLGLPRRVHVRGVDEVDPMRKRDVDHANALVMIGVADRAEHHRPQALNADLDPRAAERAIAQPQPPSVDGPVRRRR
jgi:hypothetical protein